MCTIRFNICSETFPFSLRDDKQVKICQENHIFFLFIATVVMKNAVRNERYSALRKYVLMWFRYQNKDLQSSFHPTCCPTSCLSRGAGSPPSPVPMGPKTSFQPSASCPMKTGSAAGRLRLSCFTARCLLHNLQC